MQFKELEKKVLLWAAAKDLLSSDNKYQQYAKFQEESTEILVAMNKDKIDEQAFIDSPLSEAPVNQEIENELKDAFGDTLVTLIILAAKYALGLEECLELAYNEIKDRTGKTVGGTFIKD
tara:strand:+ start:471 stop:830 length:360 start_codon:yes stop_codon:yes gene_type:complete